MLLQFFHWKNFNTYIDHIANKECHVFNKEIVGDERVLTELNLDSHPILDEVSLIVRRICRMPRSFDFLPLILR